MAKKKVSYHSGPNGLRSSSSSTNTNPPNPKTRARHPGQDPQNVQPTTISMTKSKKPPSYSTQGIINDAVSGISRKPAKPMPKPKAKAPAINSPYGPKTSGPSDAPARKPKPKPLSVINGISQSTPSSRQQQKSAQNKRRADAVAKRQDAVKTGAASRKKKTFGASGTRRTTPGDQSTRGRGGSR